MKYLKHDDYEVKIAGHQARTMIFSAGVNQCAGIKDGVALEFNDDRHWGCWVLSYKDLLEMAKAAQQWREKKDESAG